MSRFNVRSVATVVMMVVMCVSLAGCGEKEEVVDMTLKKGKYAFGEAKAEFYEDNMFLAVGNDGMNYVGTYEVTDDYIECAAEKKSGNDFSTENVKEVFEFQIINTDKIDLISNQSNFDGTYDYAGAYDSRLMARELLQGENNHVVSVVLNNEEIWNSGDLDAGTICYAFIDFDNDGEKEFVVQNTDAVTEVPSATIYKCRGNALELLHEGAEINVNNLTKYSNNSDVLFVTSYKEEMAIDYRDVLNEVTCKNGEVSVQKIFMEEWITQNDGNQADYGELSIKYYVGESNVPQNKYVSDYKNYFDNLVKADLNLVVMTHGKLQEIKNYEVKQKYEEFLKVYGE